MASTITTKEIFSNSQQFFMNNPPADLNRLLSIFERGICSSSALENHSQNHQAGYDDAKHDIVYFNTISKPEKLHNAVFDQADGIYHISTEYTNDEELIKKLSDQTKIDEIFSKNMKLLESMPLELQNIYVESFKTISLNESLKENSDFLNLLSERSHKVAVLIIDNIDLSAYEKTALDMAGGFFFFERKTIEPQKIKSVLMSEKLKDAQELQQIKHSNPGVEFEFAPSNIQSAVPFSYKMKNGNIQEIQQIEANLYAPDFLPKLTEIYNNHFAKHDKPMFIHAVRL